MEKNVKTKKELLLEVKDLRERLEKAEERLAAIRGDEVNLDITESKRGKQRINESENKYRELFERSQDGFVRVDMEGNIKEFNRSYKELLGYSEEELMRHTDINLTPEKWHSMEAEIVKEQILTKGYSMVYEKEYLKRDGTIIPISQRTYLIKDPDGNPSGMWSFVRDITSRKQKEELILNTLKDSKQRQVEISALLEGSRAVLEYHEFKDSARSIFNSCKNLLGATAGYIALLSKSGSENELLFLDSGGLPCIVDPKLPMPIRGLRKEAYLTGKTVFRNEFSKSEYMQFMPEGHVSLDNVLFAPLVVNGKAIGLLGIANKEQGFNENDAHMASIFGELAAIALLNSQTLESLETSEERFRSVVQTANDAIISVDSHGIIIFWNISAKTIFGYSADEAMGKPLAFIIPDRFRKIHQNAMERIASMDRSTIIGKTVELAGLRKNGCEFPIELSLATWETREGVFFTGIIRDISEHKKMEEDLRRSRDELEIRVWERTANLKEVNEKLQVEIAERKRAEEVLREQSKILEAFFTSTITPLVFLDRNFNFIRVNEAYAKACQHDVSEFPGHNHFEFYPSGAKEIFEQVVQTKEPYQAIAKSFTFPDHPEWGETYWDWILTPLLDTKGEVEYLVFSLEDVTNRVQAEEEKIRLAHIVEATSDLIGMANLDGQLFYLNKAGRKMLGFSKEEDISIVRIPDTHSDWAKAVVLNKGIPTALRTGLWSGETSFLSRDGTEIPASQVILAHKGLNGEVEFLSTIARDISERKRADDAVKIQQKRFNDVLEILPAYLVLLTPDYHVAFANRFFRERFGESLGRRCFEYLFGRSEPCDICETYTVLKTNAPHHWEWVGPDGRIYDIYDFPFTDADGSPLIMEMGIDITERKRAEEALRAAQQYNRSLIEASLDPLVTISVDGKVMDVNRATEFITGVPREQLIGSDFSDYFTEHEKAREGYQQVFTEGSVKDYPLTIRHTSGNVTEVLYNATVYRNETGEVQGVFAAARDVTRRREAERRTHATNVLLELFSKKSVRQEYLNAVVELLQAWSGSQCLGIRVLNKQGFIPYASHLGFSQEFLETENWLSLKQDQCACIRVLAGNPDPQDASMTTSAGSFHCDNTFKYIGQLSEEEKARFRGVCNKNGFLSVSIIPIRYRDEVLGVIHLADVREGQVPLRAMEFIESVAPLIGEAIHRFDLEDEIRESENRLRHLSTQLLVAQENERKRISREVHDSLGQSLSAIKFRVEGMLQEMRKNKEKTISKSLESIIPIVQQSIDEARRIQMDLRPSILDDLGILATISWFCREFKITYPRINIETQIGIKEEEAQDSLKTVIYRIIQEALNNIAKHSGADLVHLSLRKTSDKIELVIQDNGMGFDIEERPLLETSRRGLGLTSMRERAELSEGSFTIESIKGKGTTIRATWPFLS